MMQEGRLPCFGSPSPGLPRKSCRLVPVPVEVISRHKVGWRTPPFREAASQDVGRVISQLQNQVSRLEMDVGVLRGRLGRSEGSVENAASEVSHGFGLQRSHSGAFTPRSASSPRLTSLSNRPSYPRYSQSSDATGPCSDRGQKT